MTRSIFATPRSHAENARATILPALSPGTSHDRASGRRQCSLFPFPETAPVAGCHRSAVPQRPGAGLLARARSEEHTSELQSLMRISYAVFCLKKKKKTYNYQPTHTH